MKRPKKPIPARSPDVGDSECPDWVPMFRAFIDAFDWALDVATQLARDYPEEVEAVERVRTFMRARIAGRNPVVPVDDVLLTFGLIIGAIERDLGPVGLLGPSFAVPMRLPSARELWERSFPRTTTIHFAS